MYIIKHRGIIKTVAIKADQKSPNHLLAVWIFPIWLPHHHLINAEISAIIQLYRNSFAIS